MTTASATGRLGYAATQLRLLSAICRSRSPDLIHSSGIVVTRVAATVSFATAPSVASTTPGANAAELESTRASHSILSSSPKTNPAWPSSASGSPAFHQLSTCRRIDAPIRSKPPINTHAEIDSSVCEVFPTPVAGRLAVSLALVEQAVVAAKAFAAGAALLV